jgi:cyclophilin family peptidyl-prolyl cis-trans isomerase/HEAT repeat protein
MNTLCPDTRNKTSDATRSVLLFSLCLVLLIVVGFGESVRAQSPPARSAIPNAVMLRIVRAEDERRWDTDLQTLLADKSAEVRRRSALAAGRIGDDRAVPSLISLLQKDSDEKVQAMAAFALGEIESANAADALIAALSLDQRQSPAIRARAVEALGKIVAALPKAEEKRVRPLKEAILGALEFEAGRRSAPDDEVILFGLTAVLRARPDNAGKVVARFLGYSNPRMRVDAANTLARLKLSDGNDQLRKLVVVDPDGAVRANAARVLGATEDKTAFDLLLDRMTKDADVRVRVSAIRSLGSLKDQRAAKPLLDRGAALYTAYRASKTKHVTRPTEINEILEIVSVLGRLLADTKDEQTVAWLRELGRREPEVDIAFARIAPVAFLEDTPEPHSPLDTGREASSVAQGWGELASHPNALTKAQAGLALRKGVCMPAVDGPDCVRTEKAAVPDFLRAYAGFKPNDLATVLRKQLTDTDVVIRATAAELLGDLPPDVVNERALLDALPVALKDKDLNDALLAVLDSLAKQKTPAANDAIKATLDNPDHLIRRKAVVLLKANGIGDFSDRIGTVQTRNTTADYERALGRAGKVVRATVTTSKGAFVIEFFPAEAPLTVDNFVMLARKGYFNGQIVPRVVPNFVIQTGDPRGDQNGGPGYSIRCEINQETYDRAAVGMALSGKDTGGSQWFVTHSPQPHLDGGYTVFGHVVSGMSVVDRIVRGDIIRSITISEVAARAAARPGRTAR